MSVRVDIKLTNGQIVTATVPSDHPIFEGYLDPPLKIGSVQDMAVKPLTESKPE